MDLTPDVDNTGDSHATWVSDVSAAGFITVAGLATESVGSGATFWTVDVTKGKVVEVVRFEGGQARDVNADGDVVDGSENVWNWLGGPSSTLPGLDRPCSEPSGRHINDAGTVIGTHRVRFKGRCRGHAVIWTRIDP